jgi:type IV secretion system protein VirB4
MILRRIEASKEGYFRREFSESNFIPYKCHWNNNTILTKKNELMQVIKISGFSFETADDEDLDIRKRMRNLLYKNLASGNVSLYFHTIRRRKIITDKIDYTYDPTLKQPTEFVNYLAYEWSKKYSAFQSFVNELYITVIYKQDKQGAAIVEFLYKKLLQKGDKDAWSREMYEMAEELSEISGRILNTFKDYDAELLGIEKTKNGNFCRILKFLGKIVNCSNETEIGVSKMPIDQYISNTRLFFGSKSLEARSPKVNKYAGIVSIKEYTPSTYSGIFDRFLQLPFEFIISQSFNFSNRTIAISKMQLQQNRMIQAEDKAISQIKEISVALDMAMSGDIGFGIHHMTILCTEDNLKALENNLSIVAVELSNCGMQAVRESVNLEPTYWGQLPGNVDYIVRKSTINTLNLASFASMHNYPIGKKDNNHWGEYVTILETTSKTPYYFSFHVRDVGHTLIIGPTGAGKTVLMNFLCAQAQKFRPRMYFFDKDRGAEIFIRALDGVYTIIDPGAKCHFNPLQLPDTGENRTFILDWLKLLVTTNGETLNADDIKLLTIAMDGNYRLEKRDRKLSNIAPFLGIDGPGTLAGRIAMWHGSGSRSCIFDNDIDNVDLNISRIFGFEMAELLKDTVSLGPTLSYIFHRINLSLDGYPTMIVLDEAWALIDNPVFAPKIKDWLKVLRKLNTFVIFATQSVEDAAKSQISDTLIQQTATQIFLPNLKATSIYTSAFMLTQREYSIIKSIEPASRYFIVKQGLNAIVARVNLGGMDDIINVLSGRVETVIMLDEIRKEHGDDPEKWLPVFYQKAKKL